MLGCGKSTNKLDKQTFPSNVYQIGSDVFVKKPDGTPINLTAESLTLLNEQLKIFIAERQRMPASFKELADTRLDSVPALPAGFSWGLDSADRKVVVVPAPSAK